MLLNASKEENNEKKNPNMVVTNFLNIDPETCYPYSSVIEFIYLFYNMK